MRPSVLGLGIGTTVGGVVGAKARGATLVPWPTKVRDSFPGALGGLTGTLSGVGVDL